MSAVGSPELASLLARRRHRSRVCGRHFGVVGSIGLSPTFMGLSVGSWTMIAARFSKSGNQPRGAQRGLPDRPGAPTWLPVAAGGAVPVAGREFAAAVKHRFPGLVAVQALEDHFLTVDETDAYASQLIFHHVAHIHFVQTFTVEDLHRDYLSRSQPRSFEIAPGNAGVKPPAVGKGLPLRARLPPAARVWRRVIMRIAAPHGAAGSSAIGCFHRLARARKDLKASFQWCWLCPSELPENPYSYRKILVSLRDIAVHYTGYCPFSRLG